MLVKWQFQFGDDEPCAEFCEIEKLNARMLEVIGRTIVESMLLYASAPAYVDRHGNLQLLQAYAEVKISGYIEGSSGTRIVADYRKKDP